jgi:hypothetical protein
LCLPLLAIIALFARQRWREPSGRFVVLLFACACVLAMGPLLEVLGYRLLPLPGAGLVVIPLIDKALPARFIMYAYLVAAVLVAMWLAEKSERQTLRWSLGLAIIPFMAPNLSARFWTTAAQVPAFFGSGLYRQYLAPGETVIVLPFGLYGEGMLWQAAADMYFRMASGYVGWAPPIPEEHRDWPIMSGFYRIAGVPQAGDQLKAYLANHDVSAVIIGPRSQYLVSQADSQRTSATWLRWPTVDRERIAMHTLLASLDAQALEVGGITLYRLPPQTLAPYRQLTGLQMQQRAARVRFDALLLGAERYLSQGRNPAELSPQALQAFGLAPLDWFGGEPFPSRGHPIFRADSILRRSKNNGIEVGIIGSYAALKPIVDRYSAETSAVYFPYPTRPTPSSAGATSEAAMMVMEFDRAGLARAAAAAAANAETLRESTAAPSTVAVPAVAASSRPGNP